MTTTAVREKFLYLTPDMVPQFDAAVKGIGGEIKDKDVQLRLIKDCRGERQLLLALLEYVIGYCLVEPVGVPWRLRTMCRATALHATVTRHNSLTGHEA